MKKKRSLLITFAELFCLVLICFYLKKEILEPTPLTHDKYYMFTGFGLGTEYKIAYDPPQNTGPSIIKNRIETLIGEIDNSFSLWKKDSELTKINNSPINTPIQLSDRMSYIFKQADKYYKVTDGIFEPTIYPLLELWGFGTDDRDALPDPDKIAEAKNSVNFSSIKISDNYIEKTIPNQKIDFSAIIPGYTADEVAKILDHYQIKNYLIDIGGEIRLKGFHGSRAWQIAIENPTNKPHSLEDLNTVLSLTSGALATSGTYRKKKDGVKKRHHIIDPRTANPAQSDIESVTVYTKDSALAADALSTSLLIMGSVEALKWLKLHPEYAAYMIKNDGSGVATPNFPK